MQCCSTEKPSGEKSPKSETMLSEYRPLWVMVLLVLIGSAALSHGFNVAWMPVFMGLFLLNFAMFKLFDCDGFARDFMSYDVIAKRSRTYAKIYPFIELALALGYLLNTAPLIVNIATLVVMLTGLAGIIKVRLAGSSVRCACMGSLINVPVGTITIIENVTMAVMAAIMVFYHFSL